MRNSTVALCCLLPGCITPCAWVNNTAYVGVFSWERTQPCPEVEYGRLQGVGVALGLERVGVGYFDLQVTIADVTGAEAYLARTPLADVTYGDPLASLDFLMESKP